MSDYDGSGVRLAVEPLTKAAFAPFGDVLERAGAAVRVINDGTTDRLHALAPVDAAADGGWPIVSIFQGRRRPFPLRIAMMERHRLGSQAFVPLQPRPWLVVVAEGADAPTGFRAFLARGDQGVSYRRGTWHHPLLILGPTQDFLVVDRDGPGDNLEEVDLGAASFHLDASSPED